MKTKKIITFLIFFVVLLIYVVGLTGCSQYTCPTYSKRNPEKSCTNV